MKLICASDSFKGSLSSAKICDIVKKALNDYFEDNEFHGIIMADGGEGTLDAVLSMVSGQRITIPVKNPLGEEIMASYAILHDPLFSTEKTAFIELAKASGLTLIPEERRNPMISSTYGTGQLIRHALENGCRHIYLAIGGSATNDGGIGAMEALGVRFFDTPVSSGNPLLHTKYIVADAMHPFIREAHFTVLCDVNNPLTGANGATYTFGPQKGASKEELYTLEQHMIQYEALLSSHFSCNVSEIAGGGAAGGIGAALALFLNAKMQSGAETILELCHFDRLIENADLVITGEGRMDAQTAGGKAASVVASHCKRKNIPCCAIVGSVADGITASDENGLSEILVTKPDSLPLSEAIKNAEQLYDTSVRKLFGDMNSLYSFITNL